MEEFGRTPRCVCNVLAVLGDTEESMWATLHTAVEIAEAARARLTLVKPCERGRAYVWIAPFAVGSAYMPPELASPEEAARVLCRLTQQVPDAMPVTTLVLSEDTQASLLKLLEQGHFGAVVAESALLGSCRRLRRLLQREQLYTVLVDCDPATESASRMRAQFSSRGLTRDGAVNAEQVSEGRGRRRAGLWPWSARRIAGAGGER